MTIHRPYSRDQDPEGIPLTTLPIYEERDLTEEHLPSYNEAVARPAETRTRDDERRQPPEPTSPEPIVPTVTRPSRRTSHKGGPQARHNGWVAAAGVAYLLSGIGLLVAGIVCAVEYVDSFAPVLPPTATFSSSAQLEVEFVVFLTVGTVLLYPLLLMPILHQWGNVTRLGSNTPLRTTNNSQNRERINRKTGLLFSVLYFGSLVAAIVGSLQLAKTRQREAYGVYTSQTWSSKYVILQNAATNSFYSSSGVNLGVLDAVQRNGFSGWTMEIHDSENTIQSIKYPIFYPMQFNATCQSPSNTSVVDNCVSGEFINQPAPSYDFSDFDPQLQLAEFSGLLNLTVTSLNPLAFLNVTANPDVWTSAEAYQGIGGLYAPLGEWYVNNSTLLQVGWSLGSDGPCQGLQINLAEDYEEISLILVGIIWQWWVYWAENLGDCNWDL